MLHAGGGADLGFRFFGNLGRSGGDRFLLRVILRDIVLVNLPAGEADTMVIAVAEISHFFHVGVVAALVLAGVCYNTDELTGGLIGDHTAVHPMLVTRCKCNGRAKHRDRNGCGNGCKSLENLLHGNASFI